MITDMTQIKVVFNLTNSTNSRIVDPMNSRPFNKPNTCNTKPKLKMCLSPADRPERIAGVSRGARKNGANAAGQRRAISASCWGPPAQKASP
jgi:hypothetical protein